MRALKLWLTGMTTGTKLGMTANEITEPDFKNILTAGAWLKLRG